MGIKAYFFNVVHNAVVHPFLPFLPGFIIDPIHDRTAELAYGKAAIAKDTSELIASSFHETYEQLAPVYGYKTREDSAVPWYKVPKANKQLMVAVVDELIDRGVLIPGPDVT